MCHAFRIGQVLRNLISNAVKFTSIGKFVTISFRPEKLFNGERQAETRAISGLMVRVEDEGVGIPESELNTIFDKFVQSSKTKTKAGGTGLGLSICKEIVENHHGKIWAENNQASGTTFNFVLPENGVSSKGKISLNDLVSVQ